MGVRDLLTSIGTDRGKFEQMTFRGSKKQVDGISIDGGYCSGVCLDWTRRVLQSAEDRDEKFLTYSSAKYNVEGSTQTKTLKRMVTAFAGHATSYVAPDKTLPMKLKPLLNLVEGTHTIDGKTAKGVPVPLELARGILQYVDMPGQNPFNLTCDPAGAVPKAWVQHFISHIETNAQHEPKAGGGREWTRFAGELDQTLGGGKKRTFGELKVVDSQANKTYSNPIVWVNELVTVGFRDQCCTIVSAAPPGAANGHAVAVHQLSGGVYRFFDPNYGVIEYNITSLQGIIQYLFAAPYFKNEVALDSDLPVCRRRSERDANKPKNTQPWTDMAFTIFST
jgi:Yersinia/Haemophilus virulence surface antigen